MNQMNPKVDGYLRKNKKWHEELTALRKIVLDCQLTEDVKWRVPCYTFENNNVVIISGLKEYCALSFFKGVLLKDPKGILVAPGENTQAGRLIRFTDVQTIVGMEATLKAYTLEAIDVEKAGLKVAFKKTPEPIPDELQIKLDEVPALKTAFEALTPGRQRAYILHFSSAKQSKTRAARVEKCMPQILDGKGFNEDYKRR